LIATRLLLKGAPAAYHGNSRMKKLSLCVIAFLALVATLAAVVRLPEASREMTLMKLRQSRPAGKQLPAGFILPSSDVDLRISSLVAADLDADGDLDIVAAAAANGSPAIVVWVNDGGGRLTRKPPEAPKTLGADPPAPSVDQQPSAFVALVQAGSPAVPVLGTKASLAPIVERCRLPRSPSSVSVCTKTLRSRAPPVLA